MLSVITHNVVKYMQTDIFHASLLLAVYFPSDVSVWSTNKRLFLQLKMHQKMYFPQ